MKILIAALLTFLAVISPAWADCADTLNGCKSDDGNTVVTLSRTDSAIRMTIARTADDGTEAAVTADFGATHWHHVDTRLSAENTYVLAWDEYAGIAIVRVADGEVTRFGTAEDLLSPAETESRPNRWACHGEGDWLQGQPELTEWGVRFTVHSGRVISWKFERSAEGKK